MSARDDYIAKARVSGEYLVGSDRITPGSSTSQAHATSVLAYLALAELPEEVVEEEVAEPEAEVEAAEEAPAEPGAEKSKRIRKPVGKK